MLSAICFLYILFDKNLMLFTIFSHPLKTSRVPTRICVACYIDSSSIWRKPLNQLSNKTSKHPHGSFEVKCGSSEHDVYSVSEKAIIKVSSQTVIVLTVSDYRSHSCRFLYSSYF